MCAQHSGRAHDAYTMYKGCARRPVCSWPCVGGVGDERFAGGGSHWPDVVRTGSVLHTLHALNTHVRPRRRVNTIHVHYDVHVRCVFVSGLIAYTRKSIVLGIGESRSRRGRRVRKKD